MTCFHKHGRFNSCETGTRENSKNETGTGLLRITRWQSFRPQCAKTSEREETGGLAFTICFIEKKKTLK